MRVELKVTEGPAKGRSFAFDRPDIFIFGRADDANYPLPDDETISRHHFMIQVNPPDCMIMDLNSSNGTIVNKARYGGQGQPPDGVAQEGPVPAQLRHGDRITAGRTTFLVRVACELQCERCGRAISIDGQTVSVMVGRSVLCGQCGETGLGPFRPR